MILWLTLALASPPDCPDPAATYLAAIVAAPDAESAYLCLIEHERFRPALRDAIATATDETTFARAGRALALNLAAHANAPFDPDDVRALGPVDRRLLADAIKARRGRISPSKDHVRVFAKQGWYKPRPGYTDNLLTQVDRDNIDLVNDPPAPGPPAPATPAATGTETPLPPAASPNPPAKCGCTTSGAPGLGLAGLGVLLVLRRRRRGGP